MKLSFILQAKKNRVKTIEDFSKGCLSKVSASQAAGFTLEEQLYITKGEIAVNKTEPVPFVTSRIQVTLFWLSPDAMVKDKEYILKLGTTRVTSKLEEIHKVIDSSNLGECAAQTFIEKNAACECILSLSKPLAFDSVENFMETSRFVLVDNYNISGGGIILKALKDDQSRIRNKVLLRNYKWAKSTIPSDFRANKFNQKPAIIFITGKKDTGKKRLAKQLEKKLFDKGHLVYFLGIGNVLYGVDADIKGVNDSKEEHLRRLSEVAHIMLGSGMILIVTAIELSREDINLIQTAIDPDAIETIWLGSNISSDIECDLQIENLAALDQSLKTIQNYLTNKNIIK